MVKYHKKIVRLHPTINKRVIQHLITTIRYGAITSHEDGPNRDQSILTQQYTQQNIPVQNYSKVILYNYPFIIFTNIHTP
jgi:hypothetical protein